MKKPIGEDPVVKRRSKKGQHRKLNDRDRKRICQVQIIRDQGIVNFTECRILMLADLAGSLSDKNDCLVLHSDGFAFRNAAQQNPASIPEIWK